MKKSNNKGFSLVELIIVIAIMVVLIGVLAPMFFRYVEKSKQGSDIDALASAITVAQAYYADKTMPDSVTLTLATGAAIDSDDSNLDTELAAAGTTSYIAKGVATFTAELTPSGSITYTVTNSEYYEVSATTGAIEGK